MPHSGWLPVQVYKGRWNGVLVAVKVLNTAAAEVLEDFHRECAILEQLRHPNIIKYFGTASNAEGQVSFRRGSDAPTAGIPAQRHPSCSGAVTASAGLAAEACLSPRPLPQTHFQRVHTPRMAVRGAAFTCRPLTGSCGRMHRFGITISFRWYHYHRGTSTTHRTCCSQQVTLT